MFSKYSVNLWEAQGNNHSHEGKAAVRIKQNNICENPGILINSGSKSVRRETELRAGSGWGSGNEMGGGKGGTHLGVLWGQAREKPPGVFL